jgi:hypothetical protein
MDHHVEESKFKQNQVADADIEKTYYSQNPNENQK